MEVGGKEHWVLKSAFICRHQEWRMLIASYMCLSYNNDLQTILTAPKRCTSILFCEQRWWLLFSSSWYEGSAVVCGHWFVQQKVDCQPCLDQLVRLLLLSQFRRSQVLNDGVDGDESRASLFLLLITSNSLSRARPNLTHNFRARADY